MKKNLFSIIKKLLMIGAFFALFNSCTEEYPTKYITEYITETYYIEPENGYAIILNKFETIEASQWRWDPGYERYEVFVPYPELIADDFDDGALIGNVFIVEDDIEKSYMLPYRRTWIDDNNGNTFNEEIKCALSYEKRGVYFYIENLDRRRDSSAMQTYEFRISIIVPIIPKN